MANTKKIKNNWVIGSRVLNFVSTLIYSFWSQRAALHSLLNSDLIVINIFIRQDGSVSIHYFWHFKGLNVVVVVKEEKSPEESLNGCHLSQEEQRAWQSSSGLRLRSWNLPSSIESVCFAILCSSVYVLYYSWKLIKFLLRNAMIWWI